MRTRRLVALLLIAAAVLFTIGTTYEASERSEHKESATGTERSESAESAEHTEANEANEDEDEESERILGIDTTSPVAIGAGIALSLAAAAAVLLVRRRPFDLAVAVFAAAFGALDIAEAVHGLREDETTIGLLALVIAGLHLAAAWFAWRLAHTPVDDNATAAA